MTSQQQEFLNNPDLAFVTRQNWFSIWKNYFWPTSTRIATLSILLSIEIVCVLFSEYVMGIVRIQVFFSSWIKPLSFCSSCSCNKFLLIINPYIIIYLIEVCIRIKWTDRFTFFNICWFWINCRFIVSTIYNQKNLFCF